MRATGGSPKAAALLQSIVKDHGLVDGNKRLGSVPSRRARVDVSERLAGGHPGNMTKRLVDVDDELLDEATNILGASTMKEAVDRSLEAVVLAARRRHHADRPESMRGLYLAKPKVMSGAWR